MQKIFLLLGTLLLLPVFSGELVDGKFKDWKKNSPLCVKATALQFPVKWGKISVGTLRLKKISVPAEF